MKYLVCGLGDRVFGSISRLGCWDQDDNKMSSTRYWPPTSPEDLKKRVEEASVKLYLEAILIL